MAQPPLWKECLNSIVLGNIYLCLNHAKQSCSITCLFSVQICSLLFLTNTSSSPHLTISTSSDLVTTVLLFLCMI